jgi:hypothetical protein
MRNSAIAHHAANQNGQPTHNSNNSSNNSSRTSSRVSLLQMTGSNRSRRCRPSTLQSSSTALNLFSHKLPLVVLLNLHTKLLRHRQVLPLPLRRHKIPKQSMFAQVAYTTS